MVWSDKFSWLTKTRGKWDTRNKEERNKTLLCCCREKDQMSTAQVEEAFAISQWQQLPHWLFVGFRCLAALYFSSWLVTCWISFKDTYKGGLSKWFIFLTNWSFALLVLQACFLTWPVFKRKANGEMRHEVTLEAILKEELMVDELKDSVNYNEQDTENNNQKKLGFLHRLVWAFDNIASTMAIGVTLAYWVFLYNPVQKPLTVVTVHIHGINAVYVILDQFLCRRPRRLIHCYQPIAFGLIYVIFSVIYYELGGTDPEDRHFVYPFLDWQKPSKSCLFVFAFSVVMVTVIYLFLYGIYRLRTFAHQKLTRKNFKIDKNYHHNNAAIAI